MSLCTRCMCREAESGFTSCDQCRTRRRETQKVKRAAIKAGTYVRPAALTPAPALAPVAVVVAETPFVRPVVSADRVSPLILVIPDIHAPQHDHAAFGAVLAMMRENKFAELILLGDVSELVSVSWFGGPESLRSYKSEALEVRGVLRELLALHSGPVTLTMGNHDGRAEQKVEKSAPQLHGSIKDEIGFEELGVTVVPEDKQPITRGKIRFIHGHQDCGKFPALFHARKMADLYGLPDSAVIYGHTHKDQTFSRPMHGGPAKAYGLGCLERRPGWFKGADSWTFSVAVCDPTTGGVQVLPISSGVLWFGSHRYTATQAR